MHPIIPVPLSSIGYPIAYAEAVEMVSAELLPDEIAEWVSDEAALSDEDPSEALLVQTLLLGVVDSFVYSSADDRWGRLPAAFWAWQSTVTGVERNIFGSVSTKLLDAGMGSTSAFTGSPIMLMREHVEAICAEMRAEHEAEADSSLDDKPVSRVTTGLTLKRCADWLTSEFANDPELKLSKQMLAAAAHDAFPDLSGRSFDRAWTRATVDSPDRRRAGRKKQ